MNIIYIKGFSEIEGFDFWHRTALITVKFFNFPTFWDTYPDLFNPSEVFKDKKLIEIKNKKYILKIKPKIRHIISNNYNIPKVGEIFGRYYNLKKYIKYFFTLKNYSEFLEEKTNAFNLVNYYKYTLQPQREELSYFRMFPTIKLADINKRMSRYSILADHTDSLVIRNPPIRVSTYVNLPEYQKERILKKWKGITSLEPTNAFKKKTAVPQFLNPTYILFEFSPYIKNENKYLLKLKTFFKQFNKVEHLYRNDIIDVINFIDSLILDKERNRSKLDFLVDYIKEIKKNTIYHLKLVRKIFNYVIVTKTFKFRDGLYIMRVNGLIEHGIYFTVFKSTEHWLLNNDIEYIDIIKIFKNRKNLYYYTDTNKKNIKIKNSFLIINENDITQSDDKINYNEIKKVNVSTLKSFRVLKKIFFLRKRYCHSDYTIFNLTNQVDNINGTVRPYGEKIIYLIK